MFLAGKRNNNFQVDERVRIARTNDVELDGQVVTVLGRSIENPICAFYIVMLEKPYSQNGYKAIHLIESCLDTLQPLRK